MIKKFLKKKFGKKEGVKLLSIKDGKGQQQIINVKAGTIRHKERHEKLSFMDKRKLGTYPDETFIILMIFSNGSCREFVIRSREEYFEYKGRSYYLRFEDNIFNITQRDYMLIYHEDYTVPIGKQIHVELDKDADTDEKEKIWLSVTPHNLKSVVKMEYVKVLSQSQELNKYLRMVMMLSAGTIIISLGVLYMIYNIAKKMGASPI